MHSGGLTARRLSEALNANQFVLYCQPIVRLRPGQGELRYLEMLVRFLEEEEKLLPPGTFFPILQEAGLMPLLDRWVVREVLKWLVAQRTHAPNRALPRCSVNVSMTTLQNRSFVSFVQRELAASAVSPEKLSFEVSMSDIRQHRQAFVDLASRLKPLNCPIAVSGFGIGATSLPGLQRLGVRIIKIDGSLIRSLGRKQAALDKLRIITDACIGLGMHSVAEMVEEQETIALLRDAGVDWAQGFGIGMPIPLAQLH
jgi:EAL domain-containing protein (putative c-di-GMP-specific phosphodiesterase class I)